MDFVKFLLTVMLNFGIRDFLLTLAQGYLAQKMIDIQKFIFTSIK
ncbi:hypothetical protein [Ligilactobacillus murinus]|nr:hypothetical protein [Ligilactobacillus murinus]MDO4457900.1 hypothetical protein [Ligilactobacillus murinus]